jgi:xylulokinase
MNATVKGKTMDKAYFLGIDVSTTGAKALLVDDQGNVVNSATTPLPISMPQPLWSEQDPHDWWEGTVQSIRQVLQQASLDGSAVAAIGLTGQMHGLVLLDEQGQVLRPAILWNDQRTAAQCDEIRARLGFERLVQITGNNALTGFTAPKILWVQQNETEIYARARHILLPKDYVRYCLTGNMPWIRRTVQNTPFRLEKAQLVECRDGGAGDPCGLAAAHV